MASRLSEESLPAIYNSGCSGLAFNRNSFELNHFWERVDFDQVLASPDPSRVISDLSTQRLYYSLLEKGPGDCLEVLAHISNEQFLRILDYDVWRQDEFLPQRALYWVDLLRKVSPRKAYEQFRGLEEEYQLSTLSSLIKVYDQEAYEQMTDVDQDRLYRLPADALFYSIESNDSEIRDSVQGLIECVMANDMNYAMSLLAHAAYVPPNESVHSLQQFRRARLEEDGFVSYEESITCFAELDPVQYKMKWQPLAHHLHDLMSFSSSQDKLFLDEVLFYVGAHLWSEEQSKRFEQGLVSLANNLCAAAQIEADDIQTLKFIFTNGKALCSLGLEYLSDVDIKRGAEILGSEFPKDLFRIGLSLIRCQQRKFVKALCEVKVVAGAELFSKYFILQKYALMLDWLDKNLLEILGFEQCETLKGLFNRFPQYPRLIADASRVNRVSFFPIAKVEELKIVEEIINRMVLCLQINSQS